MGDDNATPSSTTQSHCSSDRTDQLADLDSAAASLTITLKQMEIPHVFIGGYAVSLLGGDRITEDVDVLVGQDCFDLLLDEPQFSRSSDNRLVFRHDRENVHIDIMNYDDHGFRTNPDFPLPNPANNSLILERRETSDKELVTPVSILQPSVLLLTELIPWHESCSQTRQSSQDRARDYFHDIEVILDWLVERERRIDLNLPDEDLRDRFLLILGSLYIQSYRLRPLLSNTLSANQMRTALNMAGA